MNASVFALAVLALPLTAQESGGVVPTAGRELGYEDIAVLSFRILDGDEPVPGRLTFWRTGSDETPELFPYTDAAPHELAVRKNVVYTLTGSASITVPAGDYRVFASRGIEWSVAQAIMPLTAGGSFQWDARLEHQVPTPGWMSGDFHLHTLTHSGHGDSNMPERIISLVGEGVDFAVATDHNHNTDYGPTVEQLGLGGHIAHVVGNEVSTPIGHFNAFPLSAERAPVDASLRDANELFRLLRAEPNAFGIEPIIQLNHPRWEGIDYFAQTGLDPVTGASADSAYSADFDSLEIFNENVGWGYYDPAEFAGSTEANLHSVLKDWFHLLNRGGRYAAVGNSDSHTVHYAFAGYPRNYAPCSSLDNAPTEIAAAVRSKALYTTLGPILDFEVEGRPMGSEVPSREGIVRLSIGVRAASWIDCDRVKIVVNGDVVETLDVPQTRMPERLRVEHPIALAHDAWIVLLVEGDDPLQDVVPSTKRPVRPIAISNPVWVDANGDGEWTAPYEIARTALSRADAGRAGEILAAASPSGQQMLLWAAVADAHPALAVLARQGLVAPARDTRLAALRGAEVLPRDDQLLDLLGEVWEEEADAYFHVAVLRAMHAQGEPELATRLVEFAERHEARALGRYASELEPMLPGHFVQDWMALGYFEASEPGVALEQAFGPEVDADLEARYIGKGGNEIGWVPAQASSSGYLELRDLQPDRKNVESALVFAQTWLYSATERSVTCAWGNDDGARVSVNDKVVYHNSARGGARPMEHLAQLRLESGWNRVLFKVENGTGDFGIYFRVLDDEVRAAARPE